MARLLVLLAIGCRARAPGDLPSTAAAPSDFTTTAGPFAYDPDATSLGDLRWADYVKIRDSLPRSLVTLARPPAGATDAAMYGLNIISEGKNVGWTLDRDPAGGYRFVFDLDHDGDLGDDPVHRMIWTADGWIVDIAGRPGQTGGPPLRARVVFDGHIVQVHDRMVRTGTIRIAGRDTVFAVRCPGGNCTDPRSVELGVDLDGDQTADLGVGSAERYSLGDEDRFVVLAGRTYAFELTPDGGTLTLRRATVAHVPRPSLKVGTSAPDFDLVAAGRCHTLAELRGQVVVLAFSAASCHFCVLDAPWLGSVPARGAEVITVATESSRDEPAIAGVPWWVTFEPDDGGAIARSYRVGAYPTYFVIDRDGSIACSRCRHDGVDATLARLLR
jgi:peroxiredoxin